MKKLSMGLPKVHLNKRILLVVAAAMLAVLITVAAWFLVSQQAIQRHAENLNQATRQAKNIVNSATKQLEQLKKEPDTPRAVNALDGLVAALQQQQQVLPAPTTILGLQLESSEQIAKAQAINQALNHFIARIQKTKDFITYQHSLATLLANVTQVRGTNANEQQALATAWHELAKDIQNLTTPTEAKEVHENLIKNIESVAASLAALPELYNKKDTGGFAAKQKEIENKINGLKTMHTTYLVIAAEQDKALAQAALELQEF